MPLMTTTGLGQDIITAAVRALYDQALSEQSSDLYYSDLGFIDYSPDVPEEQLNAITGPGKGQITIEGQTYGSNTKTREYPVTLTLRKYTSELSWTEEDLHWINRASESSKRVMDFRSMPGHHVQALYQNINEDACKVYYLGFGTTFLNVGNSEAWFGSHTIRATGATQRNTFPSTHLPLSSANLTTAINIMNRFQAQNGIQMLKVRNLLLVVPHELKPTGDQIVYSDYGPLNNNLGLQTSSKTMLQMRQIQIAVEEAPDIPSSFSTYWFLVDRQRAQKRHFMAFAWKPRMADETDYRKGTFFNEASTLFGPILQGWQHGFGSKGDNSAV